MIRTRVAHLLAAAGICTSVITAPVATADPSDLEPVCTGNQTPENDNCRTACPEGAPMSDGTCTEPGTQDVVGGPADHLSPTDSGADPDVVLGVSGG